MTPAGPDRACAVPASVTCECGRDLHVTVNLDRQQIEAAVKQVIIDRQRLHPLGFPGARSK